ncbi:MAG: glycoside hydrolase family 25 protein [Lachnospiraceae bacterium]|nr:glycoside hydrolase family 25 protein [Lachnospiraceae bacterium]
MDFEREKPRKHKKKRNSAIIFLLFTTTLFAITLCIFFLFSYINQKNKTEEVILEIENIQAETKEGIFTQAQVDNFVEKTKKEFLDKLKSMVENGEGMLTILQNFYPDYVIASSDGNYYFFPISETMEKNNFDLDKFTYPVYNEETKEWEGTATYMAGTEKEAKKGIDVSTFQGNIDWNKVKNTGIEFAIIRLGFRGYESGKIVLDNQYKNNMIGSLNAGLDTGVYFFTEALNEQEAIEEAEFVIENLKEYKINMPVVIDVEESANTEKTRTKDLTADQRTKNVIAFCERIKEAGYDVMIYGNLKSFMIMMNIEELESYDKWFAYYRYPFHFPYKIKMWQYTAYERIDGIEGKTDVNLMFY